MFSWKYLGGGASGVDIFCVSLCCLLFSSFLLPSEKFQHGIGSRIKLSAYRITFVFTFGSTNPLGKHH